MARQSIAATPDPVRLREDRAIFRALRIIESRAVEIGPLLSDPTTASDFFRLRLANETREHFEVAFLDNQHRLLAIERLFSGSVASVETPPRIIVQRALVLNAAAVLLAHNHPSGSPKPSCKDRAITVQIEAALSMVDVRLLDHVVVGPRSTVSMACVGWK